MRSSATMAAPHAAPALTSTPDAGGAINRKSPKRSASPNGKSTRGTPSVPSVSPASPLPLGVSKPSPKPKSSPRLCVSPSAAAKALYSDMVARRLHVPSVSDVPRPLWQRRRGFGVPVGVRRPAKVPLSRRRRRWVNRDVSAFHLNVQVGEGTYGQVFSASDKMTSEVVALKRIRMDNEREGFPLTAIREVKLLKTLKHENIVELKEIVTGVSEEDKASSSIYMVFEFMDYDIVKLMDTRKVHFTIPQVKNMARQMLRGIAFCHNRGILHRDIKGSNVLLDKHGNLKLADFGLARIFGEHGRKYTNRVVTLWYRAPELLLGATMYGVAVDMWSTGALIAELITGQPLFAARDEPEQLDRIFKMCGSPNEDNWPTWRQLPHASSVRRNEYPSKLAALLRGPKGVSESCVQLILDLLQLDPSRRPNAEQALDHEWFAEDPAPCTNDELKWNVEVVHMPKDKR